MTAEVHNHVHDRGNGDHGNQRVERRADHAQLETGQFDQRPGPDGRGRHDGHRQ